MIYIGTIMELADSILELATIFFPGFIFIQIYNWLIAKKHMKLSVIIFWSIFISEMIIITYQAGYSIVSITLELEEQVKIFIYLVTGAIFPFVVRWVLGTSCFSKLIAAVSNKSINDSIWDDVIEYDKSTILKVYVKGADILYVGRFAGREEKGLDSWVVITEYIRANKENGLQYYPEAQDEKSMVVVNMRDIERIEIIYSSDSKVWKKFNL